MRSALSERKLIMLPGPTNVPDRVMKAMTKPIISHRSVEFRRLFEEVEEGLRYVFQTKNDVYVLTASGTGGVECAINNVVSPGDNVVIPTFGVFSERAKDQVLRRGGMPIELTIEWGEAPTVERIREALEGREIKAILIVYNETSTGVIVRDLPKIGEAAKDSGALLIVDAISVLGGDKLPIDEWNVDVCVTGSQKCLACPPGLSMISVSERAWEVIEKTPARSYYFDLIEAKKHKVEKETPFTPALPLYYALNEALKIVKEEGLKKRIERHAICAKAFYEAIEAIGLKPFPKAESVRSNTVIAINAPQGVNVSEVLKLMDEKYGVVIAGGMGKLKRSMFRIGCMGMISQEEVMITINALERALNDVGFRLKLGEGIKAARSTFSRHA